jgi:hypothetical protein
VVWRADFVKELLRRGDPTGTPEHGRRKMPTMLSTMHMYPVGRGGGRVGKDETAWSYRDAKWAQVIVGIDPDPANRDAITAWSKNYYDAVHPYFRGRRLREFHDDEGEDRVKATYRDHYPRLASVKARSTTLEPVPREPEHQAVRDGGLAASGQRRFAISSRPGAAQAPIPLRSDARAGARGVRGSQARLSTVWDVVSSDTEMPATSIVVPSLTLDNEELQKLTGVSYYEERLLFLLIRLRNRVRA